MTRLSRGVESLSVAIKFHFEPYNCLSQNLLEGLVALTMVVALSFVASGIVKLFFGWAIRSMGMGIWVILSGVFSVAIGMMLLGNILGSAPWVLGVLLGIELLSDGIASVALWLHGRKA